MDLESWFLERSRSVPTRSDSKSAKFKAEELDLPDRMATRSIRAIQFSRSPGSGSISIEGVLLTARRDSYRALGLLLIAYAMSPQRKEFRLGLTDEPGEISELVVWPSERSDLEVVLQCESRITQVRYKPALPEGNPEYTTTEQDRGEDEYPREHLPYCRPGSLDVDGGGVIRQGEPVAAHFKGTAPSLIWLGKYFLNLALEDCNATLAYLYNTTPAESMRWLSAELRITVADPADGPKM